MSGLLPDIFGVFGGPRKADPRRVQDLRRWFAYMEAWNGLWDKLNDVEDLHGTTSEVRAARRELVKVANIFKQGNALIDEAIQRAIAAGDWPDGAPETVHELMDDESRTLSGLGALPALILIGVIVIYAAALLWKWVSAVQDGMAASLLEMKGALMLNEAQAEILRNANPDELAPLIIQTTADVQAGTSKALASRELWRAVWITGASIFGIVAAAAVMKGMKRTPRAELMYG